VNTLIVTVGVVSTAFFLRFLIALIHEEKAALQRRKVHGVDGSMVAEPGNLYGPTRVKLQLVEPQEFRAVYALSMAGATVTHRQKRG
jgi:hypothetical protein